MGSENANEFSRITLIAALMKAKGQKIIKILTLIFKLSNGWKSSMAKP